MYDLIKKDTAIKLSQYGISSKDISNRIGVPYATVCKWIRENQKRIWKRKSKQMSRKAGTQTGTLARPVYTVRARVTGTTA